MFSKIGGVKYGGGSISNGRSRIQNVAKIAESGQSASKSVALIPREILTIYCSLDLSFSNDY